MKKAQHPTSTYAVYAFVGDHKYCTLSKGIVMCQPGTAVGSMPTVSVCLE